METTKLTLEHLSVYLPYGLKSLTYFDNIKLVKEIDCNNVMGFVNGDTKHKPILKPLSYYKRDFVGKVDERIPRMELSEIYHLANNNVKLKQLSFSAIMIMAKEHIDMFNLIPAGLAINYFETI